MKDLRTALRILFTGQRGWVLWIALASTLLASLIPSLPPYLMKRVIDDGVVAKDLARLWQNAILYIGAVIVDLILQLSSQTALATLGQRAMFGLRRDLFHQVQSLDLQYFDREPKGRILTRLTNDVEALSEMFTSGAITMFADFVVAVTLISVMFALNVKLTVIVLLTVPPLVLLVEYFRRSARETFRAQRGKLAHLNAFLGENLAGSSVIAAFNRGLAAVENFKRLSDDLQDTVKAAVRIDASLYAIVEAIGSTAVAAMIWFGSGDLTHGAIQLGVLIAFVQYVQRFFIPIRDLSSKFAIIQSGLAAAERIDQFRSERPVVLPPTRPQRPEHALPIQLAKVSYGYLPNQPVLNELELELKAGNKLAIVGPTGSGKTTLIKLILRLCDPTSGAISAGGIPLKEWDITALRRRIALVPQEPVIFAGTVRDNLNLSFDHELAPRSDSELMQAAFSIGTAALIHRLPGALDAPLSERGANLSSGEAQLLAFTRAIAGNPDLLILDEATSSIDAQSESLVQAGLSAMLQGRTAIIIAHRLATLRMADEIIVLEHGRIGERGTHDQLMAKRGLYYALYELQFAA